MDIAPNYTVVKASTRDLERCGDLAAWNDHSCPVATGRNYENDWRLFVMPADVLELLSALHRGKISRINQEDVGLIARERRCHHGARVNIS